MAEPSYEDITPEEEEAGLWFEDVAALKGPSQTHSASMKQRINQVHTSNSLELFVLASGAVTDQ